MKNCPCLGPKMNSSKTKPTFRETAGKVSNTGAKGLHIYNVNICIYIYILTAEKIIIHILRYVLCIYICTV